MYYDKQIRYIDYLENGEKQRNCGYVKITVTDHRLLMDMQIPKLHVFYPFPVGIHSYL